MADRIGKPISQRQLRVGEMIKQSLSMIFLRNEAKVPNLETNTITVTEVRMSQDLKIAKAYVLPLGGKNSQEIVLADEISPDTCRLWDVKSEKKLDKDRFRKDLGNIVQAYQEVARRLGIMPEETNVSEVNFGKTTSIKFKKK